MKITVLNLPLSTVIINYLYVTIYVDQIGIAGPFKLFNIWIQEPGLLPLTV
jgi:hypothetical protein